MSAIASAAEPHIAGHMPDVANVRWLPKADCLHDEACGGLDWALLDFNPDLRERRIEEDIVVRHRISGCLAFSIIKIYI
jgi:hypothetical protein